MGKNKLARWNELSSFDRVIEPEIGTIAGTDHEVKGNWNRDIFQNDYPLVLELGCGKGEYSTGLAARFNSRNFIGIDIKGARMWRGAKTANEQKLPNVAFLRTRIEFVNSFFSCDEVDEIWITFPDPHPGGRNSNKRLTSPWFLNRYKNFLKNRGIVHLKTDNAELFEFTFKVASTNDLEIIFCTNDLYSPDFDAENIIFPNSASAAADVKEKTSLGDILSIKTHYEKIFLTQGSKINYISFRLPKDKTIEYGFRKEKT